LVKYGLTVPQVAEVYGVDVGVIERIVRQGSGVDSSAKWAGGCPTGS
jgi:hypothetical protein